MVNLIACDGSWQQTPDGYLLCSGTLQNVPDRVLSTEDANQLSDWALIMLVSVFCVIALKRAILWGSNMNKLQIIKALGATAVSAAVFVGQAQAALPAEVEQAMNDAKTDAVSLATLGLLIIIAIAAIKYLRRGA